jgi:hypothetical protein
MTTATPTSDIVNGLTTDLAPVAGVQTQPRPPQAAKPALRRDFLDEGEWKRLAKAAGIRLPQWQTPVTTAGMRRSLRKLGVSVKAYLAWSGETRLAEFAARNPDWPLRAWVGLVLEWRARGYGARPPRAAQARARGRLRIDVSWSARNRRRWSVAPPAEFCK